MTTIPSSSYHPPNEKNLVTSISAPSSNSTLLSVNFVTADVINVHYTFLPGCTPSTFGCVAALWQDLDTIPWDNAPIATQAIPTNQQSGDVSFTGLTIGANNYIVGLTVGPLLTQSQAARNTAASAYIPNPNGPFDSETESLALTFVGTNSVVVQFNALSGYRALTDGGWMAIWRGAAPSYTTPPLAAVPIQIDAEFGTVSIPVQVGIGLTYTVGFFKSGWSSNKAPGPNQQVLSTAFTFTQGKTKK